MTFDFNELVNAVVHSTDKIEDLSSGPTASGIFSKICQYLNIRKNKIKSLRTNLDFFWRENEREFSDIMTQRVLCKSFNNSLTITPAHSSTPVSDYNPNDHLISMKEHPQTSEKSKTKFVCLIGSIKIKTSQIISKNGQVSPDKLHFQLRNKLPSSQSKVSCCLTFDGFKTSINPKTPLKFWDYAYCRQPQCQCKYKFVGHRERRFTRIKINVMGNSVQHHTLALTYQLRGKKREEVKNRLRHQRPFQVHAKLYTKMDTNLAETEKNYKFKHSLAVIQTARCEELGCKDQDSDDTLDIINRMIINDSHKHPFILRYISPFTVYLKCVEQIEFLKNNPGLVFHFDATGSIIRKPYAQSKQVYLYSGVVEKYHKILSLLHLVSNDQQATIIRDMLIFFRELWTNAGIEWSPFEAVVIDWSWAGINAMMAGWNDTEVSQYLVVAYEGLTNGTDINFLTVHLCYAHFMKMISSFLRRNQVDGVRKKIVMEGMAVLCHCTSLSDLKQKVADLATILLSRKRTEKMLSSVRSLIGHTSITAAETFEEVDDSGNVFGNERASAKSEVELTKQGPAYSKSPFFTAFDSLLRDLAVSMTNDLDDASEDNEYRCEAFIPYLTKRLLPYAPLWTGMLMKNKTRRHYTNAIIENSFKIIKESLCENQNHLKAGRVIDKLQDHALVTAKQLQLEPPTQHIKKRGRIEKIRQSGTGRLDLPSSHDDHPILRRNTLVTHLDDEDYANYSDIEEHSSEKSVVKRKRRRASQRIDEPGNMASTEYWMRTRPTDKVKSTYEDGSYLKKLVNVTPNLDTLQPPNRTLGEDKSIHYHPNGTVANKDYYFAPDVEREYFVGVVPKSPIERDNYRYLRGEDYNTLYGKQWISNMIIDYCFSYGTFDTVNSDRFAYIAGEVASKYVGRGEMADMCNEFEAKCISDWAGTDGILFPINIHHHHFVLMYVDVQSKVTYLLDPATKNGKRYHNMCHDNFIKMWQVVFGKKCDFTKGSCKYPYRADGYNCGIFVIHYIQQILANGNLTIGTVNPNRLRTVLQYDCIIKSADVRERCLRCGCGETRRNETWVYCACCQKWTHLSCLSHLEKSLEEIRSNTYTYICDLCAKWMNSL